MMGRRCAVASLSALLGTILLVQNHLAARDTPQRSRLLRSDPDPAVRGILDDKAAIVNSNAVKRKVLRFQKLCSPTPGTTESLMDHITDMFHPSRIGEGTHEDNLPVGPCNKVFLDLGSHVGQSVENFINAGLPTCPDQNLGVKWNSEFGKTRPSGSEIDPLSRWVQERIAEFNPEGIPADYCAFGVEGNPIFTDRLKKMERQIMRTSPRPLRRLHYFTGTVLIGRDDDTQQLFLDTDRGEGSSVYSNYNGVQKAFKAHHSVLPVMAQTMSLSRLLDIAVGNEQKGHVIIKIDTEGAEYKALNQAVRSGTLCRYVQEANMKMDLWVEFHSREQLAPETIDFDIYRDEGMRQKMLDCGINLYEFDSIEG